MPSKNPPASASIAFHERDQSTDRPITATISAGSIEVKTTSPKSTPVAARSQRLRSTPRAQSAS